VEIGEKLAFAWGGSGVPNYEAAPFLFYNHFRQKKKLKNDTPFTCQQGEKQQLLMFNLRLIQIIYLRIVKIVFILLVFFCNVSELMMPALNGMRVMGQVN